MMYVLLLLVLTFQNTDHWNVDKGKLAIDGYDPVSYFTQDKPVEGKGNIVANHRGVTFRFASESNREIFLKDPQMYVPEYGGWCAYAMGVNGDKVKIDPETYKIIDDKLYLFYNFWGNNTLEDWNEDEQNLKKKADEFWEQVIKS